MLFSKFMSWINLPLFLSLYRGGQLLNVDAPVCLLPALPPMSSPTSGALRRRTRPNFVAVLTCMAGNDPEFAYSGALLAFIHLGNALYSVDHEAYWPSCETLSPAVQAIWRRQQCLLGPLRDKSG
jgi:hypothetical protein